MAKLSRRARAKSISPGVDQPGPARITLKLGETELMFNSDEGALRAVEQACAAYLGERVPRQEVAATAQLVRRYLAKHRWSRRKNAWPAGIGGKRSMPRDVWASLRALAQMSRSGIADTRESVHSHGVLLQIYADAIRRADDSWRIWEDQRRRETRPERDGKPEHQWRYPRTRAFYLQLWQLYGECDMLADEIARWSHRTLGNAGYHIPNLRADDVQWRRELEARWKDQVRKEMRIKYDYTLLDDLNVRAMEAWRALGETRRTLDRAASELDEGNPPIKERPTTQLALVVDRIQDALLVPRRGTYTAPTKIDEAVKSLRDAMQGVHAESPALRALAFLQRPTGSPKKALAGARRDIKRGKTRTAREKNSRQGRAGSSSMPSNQAALRPRFDLSKLTRGERAAWEWLRHRAGTAHHMAQPEALDTSAITIRGHVRQIRRTFGARAIGNKPGYGYYRPDAPPDWSTITAKRSRRVRTT